jgi:hypothetical protein
MPQVGAGKIYHPGLPPNNDLDHSWDKRMSDGTWPTWMYPSVSENGLFEPFVYKNDLYQDRLGTNIGKTQKQSIFSQEPPCPGHTVGWCAVRPRSVCTVGWLAAKAAAPLPVTTAVLVV